MALELVIHLHDHHPNNIIIGSIVSDDDSTMRAHLRNIKDGGKLLDHIPPPIFLADPSHRIKVMSAPVFKMAQKSEGSQKMQENRRDAPKEVHWVLYLSDT